MWEEFSEDIQRNMMEGVGHNIIAHLTTSCGILKFSLKLTLEHSKLKSLCDASVTRIGDTLLYGFPQNALEN